MSESTTSFPRESGRLAALPSIKTGRANRVLAYVGSTFLILLSIVSWLDAGGSWASGNVAEQVGAAFGWFWSHIGILISGFSVIVILAHRACNVWARLFATAHNAVTVLAGICVFGAPVWLPEVTISALAPFYTVLGCLLILGGLVNIGAMLQRSPMRPLPTPANGDNTPAPRRTPIFETARRRESSVGSELTGAAFRMGRLSKRVVGMFLGFCALSGAIAAFVWFKSSPRSAAASLTVHLSADQVFTAASPAVVKVLVRDSSFQVTGQGSGFYVSTDGRLVTNYHVIQGASFATVVETGGTIRGVDSVIATDPDADLAILKVSRSGGPTLLLASSLPKVGARVYAIGNPQGFTDTLSEGIVSGLRNDDTSIPAIQTTAAISPGSSGGPLLGEDGAVVGVTAAFWTSGQSLNFAVPATRVSQLLNAPRLNTVAPKLIRSAPSTPSAAMTIEDAMQRIYREDYRAALDELAPLRDSESKNPSYLFAIGSIHYFLKNYEPSAELFGQGIEVAPDDGPLYLMRGEAFYALKRWSDAVADFRRASELGVKPAWMYTKAGNCYRELGNTTQAEMAFKYALKLDEDDIGAYKGLAYLYEGLGATQACLDICIRGLRKDPANSFLYCFAGMMYTRLEHYDDALQMFDNATRYDPNGVAGQDSRRRASLIREALSQQQGSE